MGNERESERGKSAQKWMLWEELLGGEHYGNRYIKPVDEIRE